MLYDRWRQIAADHRNELALVDGDQAWTFDQLFREGDARPVPPEAIVVAEGRGAEFIFRILQAWKWRRPLCPIEPGQQVSIPDVPPSCAHLKTTSGTTGASRFVALTAGQLAADADNIVATMNIGAPNLAAISLAHSYGFSNLITPLLLHGIPLALAASPLPESIRALAGRFAQITLPSVPALWQVWADAQAIPSNINVSISAGAPLPLELELRIWREFGLKIHNFYGSSECGGIAYDGGDSPRTDASLIGKPLRNVTVEANDTGRLVVRSAAVAQTYWPIPQPELRAQSFVTSDLGEVTPDGIRLVGRISDQINVDGRKVSPELVEQAILASGMVTQCVVFGSTHDRNSQQIIAAIPASELRDIPQLRQFLSSRIPNWQIPHRFWPVPDIPVNARGKISRKEWSDRYAQAK